MTTPRLRDWKMSAALPPRWLLVMMALASAAAAADREWEIAPYRVQLVVAFETSPMVRESLGDELLAATQRSADAACGMIWDSRCASAEPGAVGKALSAAELVPTLVAALPQEMRFANGCDKVLLAVVGESATGYRLAVREYDTTIEGFYAQQECDVATVAEIAPSLARLAVACCSPVVAIRLDPQNVGRVLITPRGTSLLRRGTSPLAPRAGDLLRPYSRQLDREGQLTKNGIQEVQWTYLVVDPVAEGSADPASATIYSHTRSPFGARRRGRVEQIAILTRIQESPVTLRVHARGNRDIGLPGFDVHLQRPGEKETSPLGRTNLRGEIEVPFGGQQLWFAYVKSGGLLVARLPVVPGDRPVVEVPLLDDRQRVEAEAKLAAVREQLIDVVARRTILTGRVRARVREGKFAEARQLIAEIDQLPGRPQFQTLVDRQSQLQNARDPQVQRRIEQMFDDIRAVLGEFLSSTLGTELRREVDAAEASASPPTAASTAAP